VKVLVKKILVVDDEEEIRDFLTDFFKERDYAVVCASNPEEAKRAIEEEKPLVVLLDIRMRTQGDGIEILKWIRANKFKVKVIMVTAVENEEVMQEAYKLGADDYITKPLSLENLESAVTEKIESLIKDLCGPEGNA
jgi:DNA-binding response OmpR family regulator